MANAQPHFTPAGTRQLLDSLSHRPNKKLGQNFLVDPNIVQKSIDLAQLKPGENVVEIGPGLGCLSTALINAGANVYAVEFDPKLASHLKEQFKDAEKFHLTEGDAIDYPLASLSAETQNYKIIANLPYAISTPWLDGVMSHTYLPERMVLMLQKEAADRFTATLGTSNYGAISLFVEGCFNRKPGHSVSSRCFYPIPGVDSVLLHLERKAEPYLYQPATKQLIRDCFTQRRKQIGKLLRTMPKDKLQPLVQNWLSENKDLDLTLRPEAIKAKFWQSLDQYIKTNES